MTTRTQAISRALGWTLVAGVLSAGRCGGDPTEPVAPGALVFADEFDGAAGTPPDPSRWAHDVGGDGWGNHQLEYDSDSATNASLDGQGHLAVVARAESVQGHAYSSARLVTRGLFQQAAGRFEARMKLPTGQGLWPAFWLLGADYDSVGWPACGEIDVMEYRGQDPTTIHGSVHGPGYSGGGAITSSVTAAGGARFDADFHVFSVDWQDGRITFSVDGAAYQTITPAMLGGNHWVFDHPFFVIVNLAVGGDYVGDPDASTSFPQTLLVDWVRVYAP